MKTESSPPPREFIAHRKKSGECQTLADHLLEVSELGGRFSAKIELGLPGQLIGLLHDLGKYSLDFQQYLCSAVGILEQDVDDNYVDPRAKKGKIDHSTAGAQTLWQEISKRGLWFAKTRSCGFSSKSPMSRSSVELENEGGVADQLMTGWIGGVEPIQKRLLRLHYDRRPV
jgi:hypothetical protein